MLLEVTTSRIPCDIFASRMEDQISVKSNRQAERPRLYCHEIETGFVLIGDQVVFEKYQDDTVTVIEMFRNYYQKTVVPKLFINTLMLRLQFDHAWKWKSFLKRLTNFHDPV